MKNKIETASAAYQAMKEQLEELRARHLAIVSEKQQLSNRLLRMTFTYQPGDPEVRQLQARERELGKEENHLENKIEKVGRDYRRSLRQQRELHENRRAEIGEARGRQAEAGVAACADLEFPLEELDFSLPNNPGKRKKGLKTILKEINGG